MLQSCKVFYTTFSGCESATRKEQEMKKIAFVVSFVVFLVLTACNQSPSTSFSNQALEYGQLRLNVVSDFREGFKETSLNGKFDKGEFLVPDVEIRLTPIDEKGNVLGEPFSIFTSHTTDPSEATVHKVPVGIYQPEVISPKNLQGGDKYAWKPVGPLPFPFPPIFVNSKSMFDGVYSIACGFNGRMLVEINGFDEYQKSPCYNRFPNEYITVTPLPGSNPCGFIRFLVTVHSVFPRDVTLNVSNLPVGMMASFSPNPTKMESILTFATQRNLASGSYQIWIETDRGFSIPYTVSVNGPVSVAIPDVNLETAIKTTLNISTTNPITNGDMLLLTALAAPSSNISDLTGLECAENLTNLDLAHNSVSDLTPLAKLGKLEFLNLYSNTVISDIRPLSGLTNLQMLWLGENSISNFAPLSGLRNLTHLDINRNLISDLRPLASLTNLKFLALQVNQIRDLTGLSGLTNLEYLDLGWNLISDLSPLSGLPNLQKLLLASNSISDPAPLLGVPSLQEVDLQHNPIANSSAIQALLSNGVTVLY
jgi:Leucine Rich repeats (2 copies)